MSLYTPVIFLDFDGVLHPNGCQPSDCFGLLPPLAETIDPFDVDIVISSTWRMHKSLRWLKNLFPLSVRNRVVGTTGDPFPGSFARWREIGEYLQEHPASDWRALDDFDFEFPPDCPQLIHCDGDRGCQNAELELLANWLSQCTRERNPIPPPRLPTSRRAD
jgi:hypothetical protein